MNIKWSFILFLSILAYLPGYTQSKKYDFSTPTDLKDVGLNKVLCVRNGNTMLFHFEARKAVIIKVFDSLHKEIASKQYLCNILDINKFDDAFFKGLYDINGEAVLFIAQSHLSKKQLIRARFNAANGDMIEEVVAGESKSMGVPTNFYVMKDKNDDGYAILSSADVPQFKECKVSVSFYDNKHQMTHEVPIEIDRKDYDYLDVVGAEAQVNGTCISISLSKLVTNATLHTLGSATTMATYDYVLLMAFIPKNGTAAKEKMIDLSTVIYPYYTHFTYNPFAQSLNVLLLSYKEYLKQIGLDVQPASPNLSLLFTLDESSMSAKHNWIKNGMANAYYKQQTDTTKSFQGIPIKMFTNDNGLSTIIYESYDACYNVENNGRHVYDSYFGKIGITQCDDEGNELWGTVLPDAQFLKAYKSNYSAHDLGKRWQGQAMFDDLPPAVYNRQFASLNTYTYNKNYYLIFNDNDGNFNNSIAHPGDTVYSFANTNACYYKLNNRKKEVIKRYLFGEPAANEYKCSFIEGADFDEQKGVYATLVQCKKDDEVSLCMAWCQLD